jgi:hypothetical protein
VIAFLAGLILLSQRNRIGSYTACVQFPPHVHGIFSDNNNLDMENRGSYKGISLNLREIKYNKINTNQYKI